MLTCLFICCVASLCSQTYGEGEVRREVERKCEEIGCQVSRGSDEDELIASLTKNEGLSVAEAEEQVNSTYELKVELLRSIGIDDLISPVNDGLFQGDIVLSKQAARRLARMVNGDGRAKRSPGLLWSYWPNRRWNMTIKFGISDEFSEYQSNKIREGLDIMMENTCLEFVETCFQCSSPAIFYIPDSLGGSCGTSPFGVQEDGNVIRLNGDRVACSAHMDAFTIHETMHSLGIFHTQSRTDRDEYVQVNWANIQPGHEANFVKVFPEHMYSSFGTEYDFASIMHYQDSIFALEPGLKTLVANDPSVTTMGSFVMQPGDISLINEMYCNDTVFTEPTLEPFTEETTELPLPENTLNEPDITHIDLAFVFDDSRSMANDIASAVRASAVLLDRLQSSDDGYRVSNLVVATFNDPYESTSLPLFTTSNPAHLVTALGRIEARGGGDCPEMVLSGLKTAAETVQKRSAVFVFTDADAKDVEQLESVRRLVVEKELQVIFITTGHCSNTTSDVYHGLAQLSSGHVIHTDDGTDFGDILSYALNLLDTTVLAGYDFPVSPGEAFETSVAVAVDSYISSLLVTLSALGPAISLHIESDETFIEVELDSFAIARLDRGNISSNTLTIRISALGSSDTDVSHVQLRVRAVAEADAGHAVLKSDGAYYVGCFLDPALQPKSIQLLSARGDVLHEHYLRPSECNAPWDYVAGPVGAGGDAVRIQVAGQTLDGDDFIRSKGIVSAIPDLPSISLDEASLFDCDENYKQVLVPLKQFKAAPRQEFNKRFPNKSLKVFTKKFYFDDVDVRRYLRRMMIPTARLKRTINKLKLQMPDGKSAVALADTIAALQHFGAIKSKSLRTRTDPDLLETIGKALKNSGRLILFAEFNEDTVFAPLSAGVVKSYRRLLAKGKYLALDRVGPTLGAVIQAFGSVLVLFAQNVPDSQVLDYVREISERLTDMAN